MMRDAPSYPHGATITMDSARWIASHRISRVECMQEGLLLTAGNAALSLHCNWGIRMGEGRGRGAVELIMPVQAHIDAILDWEAAHPEQHPVGSREGSYRHIAWSALRTLSGDALVAALSTELADAARVRHDGHPLASLHLRPAGTAAFPLEGGAFIVAATLGSDRVRYAPGDLGAIAIGHIRAGGVEWLHIMPDRNIVDIAALMAKPAKAA